MKITIIQKYEREKRLLPSKGASSRIDNRKYFSENDILKLKKISKTRLYNRGSR
ncbi:hypothetical protein EM808_25190 [Niallia taxi]|uniref:HTH merR-type domain-containing protein n=2 Tax=Bacteria TaxID=2 RepID=A0A3S2TRF9_9BACI|nr:hypothetical protein EM808_25190 [Niallia taxi]